MNGQQHSGAERPSQSGRANHFLRRRILRLLLPLLLAGAALWLFMGSVALAQEEPAGAGETAGICDVISGVTRAECDGLVAFFEVTNGPGWVNRLNWMTVSPGAPCSWYGVTCQAGHVTELLLPANRLRGPLPRAIRNLSFLHALNLANNQLAGRVPGEVCQLVDQMLAMDVAFNLLTAEGPLAMSCMNQLDPDWQMTQTTPPTGLRVSEFFTNAVRLSWQPISYTADAGRYVVALQAEAGVTPTLVGQTLNKTNDTLLVTGLQPGAGYRFVVRTVTSPHGDQPETLISESAAVLGTTRSDARVLVLVYFSADNDLSPYILPIRERLRLGTAANPNVDVLMLGDGRLDGDTVVWRMSGGTLSATDAVSERWGRAELDTADPAVLSWFLQAGRSKFPTAARTVVSIMGHGAGLTPELAWVPPQRPGEPPSSPSAGIPALPQGHPFTPGDVTDNSYLSTADLAQALLEATNQGATPFDVVFFDQCFQGNLDVLYALRNAAKVFVASPNYAWLVAPYAQYLPHFTPSATPEQLGDAIIHVYQRVLNNAHPNAIFWVRGEDLAGIAQAASDLAGALLSAIDDGQANRILLAAGNAKYVDTTQCGEAKLELGPPDELLGAGSFARTLQGAFGAGDGSGVHSAAATLLGALEAVTGTFRVGVPYLDTGEYWDYDDTLTLLAPLRRDIPPAVAWRASIFTETAPLNAIWAPDPSYTVIISDAFATALDGGWDRFLAEWYTGPMTPTVGSWCNYAPPVLLVSDTVESLATSVITTAVAAGGKFEVQWRAPATFAPAAYHLLVQRPNAINPQLAEVVAAPGASFTFTDLEPGIYRVIVAAVDGDESVLALSDSIVVQVPYRTYLPTVHGGE